MAATKTASTKWVRLVHGGPLAHATSAFDTPSRRPFGQIASAELASRVSTRDALLVGLACIEPSALVGGPLMLVGVEGIQGTASALLFLGGLIVGQELAGTDLTGTGLLGAFALGPALGALILLVGAVTAHLLVILAQAILSVPWVRPRQSRRKRAEAQGNRG